MAKLTFFRFSFQSSLNQIWSCIALKMKNPVRILKNPGRIISRFFCSGSLLRASGGSWWNGIMFKGAQRNLQDLFRGPSLTFRVPVTRQDLPAILKNPEESPMNLFYGESRTFRVVPSEEESWRNFEGSTLNLFYGQSVTFWSKGTWEEES